MSKIRTLIEAYDSFVKYFFIVMQSNLLILLISSSPDISYSRLQPSIIIWATTDNSNSKTDYANMDNKFAGSKMGIGWSSNLAQLAMTYYWTEKAKQNADIVLLFNLFLFSSISSDDICFPSFVCLISFMYFINSGKPI